MKLATISTNGTCWQCGGTGIKHETIIDAGRKNIVLTICGCVSVRMVKPKTFAEEVSKHMKRRRGGIEGRRGGPRASLRSGGDAIDAIYKSTREDFGRHVE